MTRHDRGVSLIEVLVTVAILVIVTMGSMPMFATWSANSRIRAAAEAMQNGMRLAQAEGVRSNASVTLRLTENPIPGPESEPSPRGINWVLLTADKATVLQRKGREGVTDVTVTATDKSGATIADFTGDIDFRGLGQNNLTKPLYLNFKANTTAEQRPLTVMLTPGGRVRMCDPSRPTGDAQACE